MRIFRHNAVLTHLPLLVLVMLVAAGSTLLISGRYAEAPMQYASGGLTPEQYAQRQDAMNRRLVGELPPAALDAAIRVPLSPAEIDAVEKAPRWVSPMKIGIVKPLTPGIELSGLTRGRSGRGPSRGEEAAAASTRDGGFVWAQVISSENAGGIRLHVENFSLPRNAELYFYSRSGQAFGPYSESGPHGNGDFWTTAVFANEGILQVRVHPPVSDEDLRGISLRVSEAGMITPRFVRDVQISLDAPPPPGWPCGNPNCLVDATCSTTAAPAVPAKLAEAKMEWIQGAYIYTCTGGLIADNDPNATNYFLTANHCVSKNNTAGHVSFYWRFATSSCPATSCPSNGGWPYVTSGATVAASGRKGDFTLLHLNSNPPSGSVFLGWTNAPVASTNGAALYRISNPNFGPQVYSQHNVSTTAGTCSGWPRGERIYSKDVTGAIDGGSSGSSVLNASSQIVGQLSGVCGTNINNPCDAASNATVDGAFAFYYAAVQPILNP
jgi:lysyl endopeptidase